MKRTFNAVATMCILLAAAGLVGAAGGGAEARMALEKHIVETSNQLDLDQQQREQLRTILRADFARMDQLQKRNQGNPGKDFQDLANQIARTMSERVAPLLRPDQLDKYKQKLISEFNEMAGPSINRARRLLDLPEEEWEAVRANLQEQADVSARDYAQRHVEQSMLRAVVEVYPVDVEAAAQRLSALEALNELQMQQIRKLTGELRELLGDAQYALLVVEGIVV